MPKNTSLEHSSVSNIYTCNEYRDEMILLSLKQRLHRADLPENEENDIKKEIIRLENKIGIGS